MSVDDRLFDTRLRFVTGKGGVGRSVVALAMAHLAHSQGRRVLYCEINAPQSAARLMGLAPLNGDMRQVAEGLFMVNITPQDAIREYALMTLKFKALYNTVFENRVVKYFLRAVPSLAEFVTLGKIWFHEQEREGSRPRFDTIIIDAPATGHLISLLRVPRVFEEMVPGGPLKSSALDMRQMLEDPRRTKLDVVTLPEEMPINEAIEITRAAARFQFATRGLTVINRVVPDLPAALISRARDGGAPSSIQPVLNVIKEQAHWREVGLRHMSKLGEEELGKAIQLAKRTVPLFGKADIVGLAEELEAQL